MGGEDWVDVRLTAFGEQYLKDNGGGPLRVHDGNREFDFTPGQPLRVTRAFEWERVLRPSSIGGNALFEIAPKEQKKQKPQPQSAAIQSVEEKK